MRTRTYTLGLLKLPVRDIGKSAKFYTEELGFELDFVASDYGWAQLKTGEFSLALYQPGMGGGERPIGGSVDFQLVLEAQEFDELAQQMKVAKRLSGDRIHQGADGTTFIEICDPDDNLLKIFRNR